MTIKAILTNKINESINDLIHNRAHSVPCECVACLYFQYKKLPKRRGRQFGRPIFFLNWLIHEVKMEYLIENGLSVEVYSFGRIAWRSELGEYDKAPFEKRAKEILENIYEKFNKIEENDFIKTLGNIAYDLSYFSIYKQRKNKEGFANLIEELSRVRSQEWLLSQTQIHENREKNTKNLRIAHKVAEFIRSDPAREKTQREISRKFKIKKEELKDMQGWLKFFGIQVKERQGYRNKTTVYSYKKMTKDEEKKYREGLSQLSFIE